METRSFFIPKLLVALIAATAPVVSGCGGNVHTLFENGNTSYTIVVAPDASESERTAARELKHFLQEASGAKLEVSDDLKCRGAKIFVGYNSRVGSFVGKKCIADDDESFTYESVGKDIFIYGGKQRGTLYGVYAFLENEIGFRWYTPDCTRTPSIDVYRFTRLNHSESPAVKYRYSNYFGVKFAPEWSARNKENMKWDPSINSYGNLEAYWSAHTMEKLVPEEEFYDIHPEYFALRDGKRQWDRFQLCLSNPEVLRICTERLAEVMAAKPEYRIYSLSQNDNLNFCECEECRKLEEQYGGHSGLILWFVNQVADAVKEKFPDKYVGTFAYQYSRKPPVGIVPRDNVVIRLCSIEECQLHDMDSCEINREFVKDLQDWSAIAPKLCIWDYVGTYFHYLAPLPNLRTFQSRIKLFRDYGAFSVMPQGNYQSTASIFDNMKAYVTAKLLWDPDCDELAAENDFIDGVFGPAADYIREYLEYERQAIITPYKHQNSFVELEGPGIIYPDDFEVRGREIFRKAYDAAAGDSVLIDRIESAEVSICYLQMYRNPYLGYTTGAYDLLKRVVERDGIRFFREGSGRQSLEEVFSSQLQMAPLLTPDAAYHGEFKNEGADKFFYLKKAGFEGAQLISPVFKGWNGDSSFYLNAYEDVGGRSDACYRLSGLVEPGVSYYAEADTFWEQGEVTMSGFDPDVDYTILFSDISKESMTIRIVPFSSLLSSLK